VLLQVESIGYLVPGPSFDGTVHSVFARACNIACRDSLLTLVAPGVAAAPTALVLARGANDLRSRYRVGDAVARRGTRLASRDCVVDLAGASVWRPDDRTSIAEHSQLHANLRECRASLDARLPERASIVHREGRAVCARLERACRDSDVDVALTHASRLIGWGEGLTPAGDDFLVGMLAALHAMTSSAARATFVARLGDALEVQVNRTTSIAAHALRLAAHGHFSADLHRLRDALLSADDVARVRRLADDALDVGATSGVDRVAGLIAGVSAWLR
jgi:hypothetical protein